MTGGSRRARLATLRIGIVVALAGACLGACSGDDDATTSSTTAARPEPLEPASSEEPLVQPRRIESDDGVLQFHLVASGTRIGVAGADIAGQVYDERFVGPALVVNPGDRIALTVENRLDAHTNVHFHGLHVSPAHNGDNIFLSIEPGETFHYSIEIPDDHPPGTFWYHSHAHGLSEDQVFGGLSGLIIVQGLAQRLPPELRDITDVALALKDTQVVGNAIEASNIDSNAPTLRTVNGQHLPVSQIAPGETQLWRLANIGADIWYDLHLDRHSFHVIGEDGNPVWEVWDADHLVLPPGKRYDVLVTANGPGTFTLRTLHYNQQGDVYPERPLLLVSSAGEPVAEATLPTALAPAAHIGDADIARRRTMVFTEDDSANEFFINGKEFDPDRVDVRVRLGTTEEWTLRNSTSEQHPFHIHVNDFEVVSVGGVPYDAHSLQDTVALLPGKDVVVRMRFLDFTGRYVYHCHILNHEDNGMMAVVEVA